MDVRLQRSGEGLGELPVARDRPYRVNGREAWARGPGISKSLGYAEPVSSGLRVRLTGYEGASWTGSGTKNLARHIGRLHESWNLDPRPQ